MWGSTELSWSRSGGGAPEEGTRGEGSRRGRLTEGEAHLGEGTQRGMHTPASETWAHHTCISEALESPEDQIRQLGVGP